MQSLLEEAMFQFDDASESQGKEYTVKLRNFQQKCELQFDKEYFHKQIEERKVLREQELELETKY